mgnify:CR=1 FL=1
MLIHAGPERAVSFDLRLAVWLSLAAGAVNAAGFRALGYFSANMTGNVSAMSDALALGRVGTALWLASLVVGFVVGAFVSGLLIARGEARGIRGIYAFSILLEAGLLVALAVLVLIIMQMVVLVLLVVAPLEAAEVEELEAAEAVFGGVLQGTFER